MRSFVVVFALVAVVYGQANKDKLMQRGIDLGITFFTKAELTKMATCMEDPFYKMMSMDDMKTKGVNCVMNNCPMTKLPKAMDLLAQMDKCLKPEEKTMELAEKLFPVAKSIAEPFYDQAMAAIKKGIAAKQSKADVLNAGYGVLLNLATKDFVNNKCTEFVKAKYINGKEWNCTLTIGPKAVNINGYSCAKIKL